MVLIDSLTTDNRQPTSEMLYVSQILNRPIFDARNEKIAVIKDVLVNYGEDEHPPVIGLVARYRRRNFFMPSRDF